MLLGLLGCNGPTPDETTDVDEQGIIVALREVDGSLVDPPEVSLGGASIAVPDAGGLVYFFGLAPGRTPVGAKAPIDRAGAYSHANVAPAGVAAARLVPLPLTWSDETDASAGATIEDGDLAIEVPPAALAMGEAPASGEWRLGWGIPTADQRETIPGDHLGSSGDADIHAIDLHATLAVEAVGPDGDPLDLLPEERLTVTLAVSEGSPLLGGDAKTYAWSHGRAYWIEAAPLAVNSEERTVSFEVGSFGWFGLGERAGDLGCVSGRMTDEAGVALSGIEVRLEQDGAAAPDRTTTVNGTFCLVAEPGAHGTLSAAGFAADRSRMFTWTGEATAGGAAACGSLSCTDLGTIAVEIWPDADGDRVFSGPGGDCDDSDPSVNPSLTFGDTSYCGGPL